MPDSHQSTLFFLVAIIGLLFLIIVGTVVLSQIKKKKTKEISVDEQPAEVQTTQSESVSQILSVATATEAAAPADYSQSLSKTRSSIWGKIQNLFSAQSSNPVLEEIEEVLLTADIGPQTVMTVIEKMQDTLAKDDLRDQQKVKAFLQTEFSDMLGQVTPTDFVTHHKLSERLVLTAKPTVLLIVGVNGAGKTTSIGKIAAQFAQEGKKVLVAAGDTFRAAAGSQLAVWTERAQVEIFAPEKVLDPSAVAYEAVQKAKNNEYDLVIIDTAGRLHTQVHLMEELKKVKRVIAKVIPEAPHETLLVLDANQGQNALIQAKEYNLALEINGVILTKMDGTAKGGVAIGLANEVKKPIKLIGLGEKINDLELFQKDKFVNALFEN